MSEKELNEQYIKNKIQGICQDCMWFDKTIPIINKMLSEAYISGFEQGKFDLKMDLQQKVEQQDKEIDRLNKEYERIYNENCKLREEHNITDIKLLDENNRLKNIIDELEKWIEEHKQYQLISERYIVWEDKLVNKLKALKENNNE